MVAPRRRDVAPLIAERLQQVLGPEVEVRSDDARDGIIALAADGRRFIVAWSGSGAVAAVARAVEEVVRRHDGATGDGVSIVATPFMGEAGRRRCEEADVGWLDLSGNASIRAPNLLIHVVGQPNRYKRIGRPATAFSPKSSRVARWLLIHGASTFTQREIAKAVGISEGFTSKIVRRLLEDGLVERVDDGSIRPCDPGLVLDAWYEQYRFSMHRTVRGSVAARSGESLLERISFALASQQVRHAGTGLAAAWLLDRFATYRTVLVYVAAEPPKRLTEEIGFREEPRGANLWFVVPKDEGVFHGGREVDGIPVVAPVQTYLDLKDHPERAREAADHLRATVLEPGWSGNG